MGYYTVTV